MGYPVVMSTLSFRIHKVLRPHNTQTEFLNRIQISPRCEAALKDLTYVFGDGDASATRLEAAEIP